MQPEFQVAWIPSGVQAHSARFGETKTVSYSTARRAGRGGGKLRGCQVAARNSRRSIEDVPVCIQFFFVILGIITSYYVWQSERVLKSVCSRIIPSGAGLEEVFFST